MSLTAPTGAPEVPLRLVAKADLDAVLAGLTPAQAAWARAQGFTADAGKAVAIPDGDGGIALVLAGRPAADTPSPWAMARLARSLPAGLYRLDPDPGVGVATPLCLGWALAGYRFDRYRKTPDGEEAGADPVVARLVWPPSVDRARAERLITATVLVRDLVNTPASDMGPVELGAAAEQMAAEHDAGVDVIAGDDLVLYHYPAIHAVGRASARPPRLIDLTWGAPQHPKVTLIGKGVCFDTGGLDLKPANNMALMKKDMGGAAHALALAGLVMAAGLPVRLRLLIPAVENSVSADSFRPGDIIATRKGLSVEIGNTDAEGRLVLADALFEADREAPGLILDFATLTGAARVALGADIPALFTNDDRLAQDFQAAAEAEADPVWRLPLHDGYKSQLNSPVADLNNAPAGGFAGAITAALFLERFVSARTPWAHLDLYAWNQTDRPGRPKGGEAMGLRAAFRLLEQRYPVTNC